MPTLGLYIGRQYLSAFLIIIFVFLLVIFLGDVVELLRKVASKPEVSFNDVVRLALLNVPYLGQKTFPFAALAASMLVFWRLSRQHELSVIRAIGVSAWQFLRPALLVAGFLGVLQAAVVNPIAATFQIVFKRTEAGLADRQASMLAFSRAGLWLRQPSENGQSIFHAAKVAFTGKELEATRVSVFNLRGKDHFVDRIEAATARLHDGYWLLQDVWVLAPEQPGRPEAQVRVPTDLTLEMIRESFASPETVSFWRLPEFIASLEATGFSAVAHRLHFNSLLAAPLLMCAMVLVGAVFSLRPPRSAGTVYLIAGGILSGFALHLMSDIVFALGLADRVPVALAAVTPPAVALLLGITGVLFREDG